MQDSNATNRTAYGTASREYVRAHYFLIHCTGDNATCYTIYDNGEVDVFFSTGTLRLYPVEMVSNQTGQTVNIEDLPEEFNGADYSLFVTDCENCNE